MKRVGKNTYLTAFGETKTIAEWTRDERCVVKEPTTLSSRVRNAGMDDLTAITTPLGANVPQPIMLTYQGETKDLRAWLQDERCAPRTRSALLGRIERGWSAEKVLTHPVKNMGPKRSKLEVTAWGETKTVTEWVEDKRCKVDAATLYRRLKRTEYSAEQVMSVPPGRLTTIISAWGEHMTPHQWEKDPRCRVSMDTLRMRVSEGWAPEEAIRTPSLRDDEMTLEQRFEAEINAVAAMSRTTKKERLYLIGRDLLLEAAGAVKGEVQISNKYLVGKRFCMGIWAEPTTMLDLVAELAHLAAVEERYRKAPVRRFLRAMSERKTQGSGDLYLFAQWFCADADGEVWRG